MSKCLYCDRGLPPEHFICEVCGDGMCEECYNEEKEHECHYQDPSELNVVMHSSNAYKIFDKLFKGGYGCQECVDDTIKKYNLF